MKNSVNCSTTVQCPELLKPFYSVKETMAIIGKSKNTILTMCRSGRLPSIPEKYGNTITYKIPVASIKLWFQELQVQQAQKKAIQVASKAPKNQEHLLPKFRKACENGMIEKHHYSERTISDYLDYLRKFFAQYPVVNYQNVRSHLLGIDSKLKEKQVKAYKAFVCFSKFLVGERIIAETAVEDIKKLKPQGNKSPKQAVLKEADYLAIVEACTSDEELVLITILGHTGIRASEFCGIQIKDINLPDGYMWVLGKGGIPRRVGLTPTLKELLQKYITGKPQNAYLIYYEGTNDPMNRHGVYRWVKNVGERAGVTTAHPHALRRAFVTINANKGRSIVHLQHACGHTRIQTTRLYCKTTEDEVVEAMKNWDLQN